MKIFKWQTGRQTSGYDKMLLATGMWPLPFDLYLLRYPEGSEIKEHVDEVVRGEHYRLNVVVKKAKRGGEFFMTGDAIFRSKRIAFFRPDVYPHGVYKVEEGTRYVVSFGCLWRSTK